VPPCSPPSSLIVVGQARLRELDRPQIEKNNLLKKEIVSSMRRLPIFRSRNPQTASGRAHGDHRALQAQAAEIVHLFGRTREDRSRRRVLTQLKENGNKLEIHGVAQSSTRVSTFMRTSTRPCGWITRTAGRRDRREFPHGARASRVFADTVGVISGRRPSRSEGSAK